MPWGGFDELARIREGMRRRGLTLIEVVVGGTLIALAVVVAVSALPATTILTNRGRFRVHALQVAQSTLEQQRARPWSALPAPPATVQLPNQTLEGTGTVFSPVLSVTAVTGYDQQALRRITVSVTWEERGATQQVQHESMVARVPR